MQIVFLVIFTHVEVNQATFGCHQIVFEHGSSRYSIEKKHKAALDKVFIQLVIHTYCYQFV